VVAACTVLLPRVLVLSALLNPAVTLALAPLVLPPFIVGLLVSFFAWPRDSRETTAEEIADGNPLRLASALQMTVAFQVAITALAYARSAFGTMGLYGTASVLGLTDMDALTVSMSSPSTQVAAAIAARALAIGILANTLLKMTVAGVVGGPAFRRAAVLGLVGLAVASALGLAFL
jgi:uncharacterized membrane protein (DUF4010 family)